MLTSHGHSAHNEVDGCQVPSDSEGKDERKTLETGAEKHLASTDRDGRSLPSFTLPPEVAMSLSCELARDSGP